MNSDLQTLMNIGSATARKLNEIGLFSASQLKKSDPEKVYERLKQKAGGSLDVCVLYLLRGAIKNVPWWKCKNR